MKKELLKAAKYLALSVALATAGTTMLEVTFDHTEKECPLNPILGIEHQIKNINNQKGLKAELRTVYRAPSGWTLEGTVAKKELGLDENGCAPEGSIKIDDKAVVYTSAYAVEELVIINEETGMVKNLLIKK